MPVEVLELRESRFAEAARNLASMPTEELCLPFLDVLPVDRAAISTLGDPFDVETVCASDTSAAQLDEVQLSLGEGPCWQALATRRPVTVPALRTAVTEWPLFADAVIELGVSAVFAFPLSVGALGIGALDLYAAEPVELSTQEVDAVVSLAAIAGLRVLRQAMDDREPRPEGRTSRRSVHQATGMVMAQMDVGAGDALLLIRAHAFATGQPVSEIADRILDRTIVLNP